MDDLQMVAMEGTDLEVGKRSGDAKLDYLQVACALQDRLRDVVAGTGDCASGPLVEILDIAAHEFGVEKDDDGMSKERREEPRAEKSVMGSESANKECEHWCCDHNKLHMNPKPIWRNLPRELVTQVLSFLPVEDINRLRILNKEWQKTILGFGDPNFCGKKLICLVTWDTANRFWVRVCDVNCSKWHTYKNEVEVPPEFEFGQGRRGPKPKTVAACEDGGLLCFVTCWTSFIEMHSRKKDVHWSIFINVMNPLTRTSRPAVPPLVDRQGPKVVAIRTDRGSRGFKLFVVANKLVWSKARRGYHGYWTIAGVTAQLYDSMTGEWTTVDDCLSSYRFPKRTTRNVGYDFASGRLFTKYCSFEIGTCSASSAVYKDRLFALMLDSEGPANNEFANESPTYFIEEFHLQANRWVMVKTHRCEPFEHHPKSDYYLELSACNGYLMVTADLSEGSGFDNRKAWLYDLFTMHWSILDLQALRAESDRVITLDVELMFEPQWGT